MMIVKTRQDAWKAVENMLGTRWVKDEVESYNTGREVYRTRLNDKIIDLYFRLKVEIAEEITNIWIADYFIDRKIDKKDKEMEQEAEKISNRLVLKNKDIELKAHDGDKNAIFLIAIYALNKIKKVDNEIELHSVYEESQKLVEKDIAQCNGFLTIYLPLTKVFNEWRKKGKVYHEYSYIDKPEQKEIEQYKELVLDTKRQFIREEYGRIAEDFKKYAEEAIEEGAFAYEMSEQEINHSFGIVRLIMETRYFIKKSMQIIDEIHKDKEVK